MKTIIKIKYLLILLCLILSVSGCGRSSLSVTVAGSTAFQPFAEKLADQYMEIHSDTNIIIQGGGSAFGIIIRRVEWGCQGKNEQRIKDKV